MNTPTRFVALFSILLLAGARIAPAADSLHEVCIGIVAIGTTEGSKTIEKLTWLYDDQRSGAESRQITVTVSLWGGKIFQGVGITKTSIVAMKIVSIDDPSQILFDGTIERLDRGIEALGNYLDLNSGKTQPIRATMEGSEVPGVKPVPALRK